MKKKLDRSCGVRSGKRNRKTGDGKKEEKRERKFGGLVQVPLGRDGLSKAFDW